MNSPLSPAPWCRAAFPPPPAPAASLNALVTLTAPAGMVPLYIPPKHADEAKAAQAAWARFWEIGCELAAGNREQMCGKWKRPARIASRETA